MTKQKRKLSTNRDPITLAETRLVETNPDVVTDSGDEMAHSFLAEVSY